VEALPDGHDGEATVFDGNWFSIGAGAVYSASYDGSDDYVVSPIPIVQGKIGGVRISPRAGGAALDFVNDDSDGAKISAGVAARLNRNRASQIEDPVVLSYGELDTAFEVGPSVGISLPGLLNPYDSLSFNIETLFDVAGAHDGTLVSPGVTYFTPVSRGAAISLSVSGSYVDDDYADYYYSVPAGGALPAYQADGGWDRVGVNLLTGVDLDGNLANGGLALIAMGGYSRMLGDGKRTPFTFIRGDADQWMGALGIGYTF
ncbi:MAG: MipA/OmpV family protein, partial [Qipengyuania citrea]